MGRAAAQHGAAVLRASVAQKGIARALFSTGASQFTLFEALKEQDVPWDKVVFFHLDEYIGIDEDHNASFARYLKDRFLQDIAVKEAHLIPGKGDPQTIISDITREIRKAPIDLGFIGIGENAHIAFNDPPANFETKEAFHVVKLDEGCRRQQVHEGWFESIEQVPQLAVSATVYQIMQCRTIISCVPGERKQQSIKNTLESDVTNMIPATILQTHPDWHLFLDDQSSTLLP